MYIHNRKTRTQPRPHARTVTEAMRKDTLNGAGPKTSDMVLGYSPRELRRLVAEMIG